VRQAAAVEHELALVTRALQEMKALEAARHSCLQLLAVLARELPPNTAVVALRADSTDVSLVVLAPQVAQVIGSLGRVPELGTAELVGPITHDVVEGQELERGTVHLRLAGASR
jgi:hypothetical protein